MLRHPDRKNWKFVLRLSWLSNPTNLCFCHQQEKEIYLTVKPLKLFLWSRFEVCTGNFVKTFVNFLELLYSISPENMFQHLNTLPKKFTYFKIYSFSNKKTDPFSSMTISGLQTRRCYFKSRRERGGGLIRWKKKCLPPWLANEKFFDFFKL